MCVCYKKHIQVSSNTGFEHMKLVLQVIKTELRNIKLVQVMNIKFIHMKLVKLINK